MRGVRYRSDRSMHSPSLCRRSTACGLTVVALTFLALLNLSPSDILSRVTSPPHVSPLILLEEYSQREKQFQGAPTVSATHLIMVPCHGTFSGTDGVAQGFNEAYWSLEPFQRGTDGLLIYSFASHIKVALEMLAEDVEDSIVVFSGGATKNSGGGTRSEAQSYFIVAESYNFFGVFNFSSGGGDADQPEVKKKSDDDGIRNRPLLEKRSSNSEMIRTMLRQRITTEDFSRDSYENVLFSIARFYELTGKYPQRYSVVGYAYKRERFETVHFPSIRFPLRQVRYVGIDLIDVVTKHLNLLHYITTFTGGQGNVEHWKNLARPGRIRRLSDNKTLDAARSDPYECSVNKVTRRNRNPHRHVPSYFISCVQLRALLVWCGPQLFTGSLPWDPV